MKWPSELSWWADTRRRPRSGMLGHYCDLRPQSGAYPIRPSSEIGARGRAIQLGFLYANGLRFAEDDDDAMLWYRKA